MSFFRKSASNSAMVCTAANCTTPWQFKGTYRAKAGRCSISPSSSGSTSRRTRFRAPGKM